MALTFYTCKDALCIVSRIEYCEIMGLKDVSRQTYHNKVISGEIKTIKMPDRLYPYINSK
jgi:hypothetical protein